MEEIFVIGLVIMGFVLTFIKSARKVKQEIADLEEEPATSFIPETDSTINDSYFTYESVESELERPKVSKYFGKEKNDVPILQQDDHTVEFDLRQAVIYQTILQNDYISDIR